MNVSPQQSQRMRMTVCVKLASEHQPVQRPGEDPAPVLVSAWSKRVANGLGSFVSDPVVCIDPRHSPVMMAGVRIAKRLQTGHWLGTYDTSPAVSAWCSQPESRPCSFEASVLLQ